MPKVILVKCQSESWSFAGEILQKVGEGVWRGLMEEVEFEMGL